MTVEELIRKRNEQLQAKREERERIVDYIKKLEAAYMSHGCKDQAAACEGIIDHIRWSS